MKRRRAIAPVPLDLAIQRHRTGQLAEAEALYQAVLRAQPHHPDAHHNLGLLLANTDRLQQSLAHFKAARDAAPQHEAYWASYIHALARAGATALASEALTQATQRGITSARLQDLQHALASGTPTDAPAAVAGPPPEEIQLAAQLLNSRQFDALEAAARAMTERFPGFSAGWKLLSVALKAAGRLPEALACIQTATSLAPGDAEAWTNQGNTLQDLNRLAEAEASYLRAIELNPGMAQTHNNLGNALKYLGRTDDAMACYRRALALRSGYAEAQSNLGQCLHELGRFDEAMSSFQANLQLNPAHADTHGNLANVLKDLGEFDAAQAELRSAMQLNPANARAYMDQLLFTLNYHPTMDARQVFSVYEEYARMQQPSATPHPSRLARRGAARIKVGYVSPDFRRHACMYFLEPLLAWHDKSAVEVYAYAELAHEDEISARYQKHVDHWVPTRALSDAVLADRIRDDGIDILVDLAGHTHGNRLGTFALRPAPLAVSWLGFGYTTGLKAIDYFLADAHSVPAGDEALFSETPWRLEGPAFAYRPAQSMGEVSPLPALQTGRVSFGTLSRSIRINPRTVRTWATILQQVPGSRLVVDSADFRSEAMQQRLAQQFAQHGIMPERLQVGFHSPPWDTLRGIDITLDCFPHNSGTTLFESLYMGVPFVTLSERAGVGRLGSAILHGLGHPEWIAHDEDGYIQRAVALAQDLPALAALRAQLRQQMQASPLMDELAFARRVEQAYRLMLERSMSTVAAPPRAQQERLAQLVVQRQYADAEPLARAMTTGYPQFAFGWKALGTLLRQLKGSAAALAPVRTAVALDPGDAETHNNLGNVLKDLQQYDAAEQSYRRAIQLRPTLAMAHNGLGLVLHQQGRLDQARASYDAALQLHPGYADAHNNLGALFRDSNLLSQAEACFRQALQANPAFERASNNLGVVLMAQGRLDDAQACFREALRINPDYDSAFGNLLFALNYSPDSSARDIYQAYLAYDRQFGLPRRVHWRPHHNGRGLQRRLKVGYASPDFRRHACQHFLEPLLAQHDKHAVEVFAYAELVREDEVTARYRHLVDHWVPTRGLSDEALAQRIRDDGIDVLVDLAGHTRDGRLRVFALKPAPVSVSWLGFGYTTGLSAVDYFLTDEHTVPPGHEALFSETVWRVPAPALVYRAPENAMGEPGELPAQRNGFVTFGTLTRAIRINHRVVEVWSALLARVPGSRLVIDSGDFRDEESQHRLAQQFMARGIARDRLRIGWHSPPWDLLRETDITLDCFPHNSGTTLFESLYLGVPFVTLCDRPSVGRLGSAILHGAGHPQWIAESEQAYVEIAARLAADLPALAGVRAVLRSQLKASPLMDEAGFARRVEAAYRQMWQRHLGQQLPA